jgi:hypothetical protein|nr:MAG TPA: recombination protein [Caudoviricetes sp.]
MIKPLNFGNYQTMKRYTYNQMNQWATSVYVSGFQDGQDSMPQILEYDENTLEEFLLSIDGVGKETAKRIVQAFIEKGEVAFDV